MRNHQQKGRSRGGRVLGTAIYDENDYFTDNAINRYSINSFMLKRRDLYVEDGKLAIYVQQDKPTNPNQLKIAHTSS